MSDLIERQAAIECLEHLSACDEPFVEIGTDDETFIGKYEAITEISDLPSAQPEIIRCMECTWYHVLIEPQYVEYCELTECTVFRNDFCSRAERRTDG